MNSAPWPNPSRVCCAILLCLHKSFVINNVILVEAAGVGLFRVLTARKLSILRMARRARKAPLPDPLYVYCTKTFFALGAHGHHIAPQYPIFAGTDREKTRPRFAESLFCKSKQDDSEPFSRARSRISSETFTVKNPVPLFS